ncbi:MAG: DUF3081 domain-containing protein [Natronospirillum sp.]|uniref:DUF3081 family protein n=1 Tax=Natronospirillum sp. TaxID=2812955 RepID=UPI0025D8AE85|nr:DUF3081 family protein [Natronospirillum sp.]MCH8552923.1 DUF3081 domain-containing protein [Natronospirillum sp.]
MEKLDSRTALLAFQIITDKGEKAEEGFSLDGLTATSAIDGYTVQLTDGTVSVTVMFHHSIAFDTPSNRATKHFLSRVEKLIKKHG